MIDTGRERVKERIQWRENIKDDSCSEQLRHSYHSWLEEGSKKRREGLQELVPGKPHNIAALVLRYNIYVPCELLFH